MRGYAPELLVVVAYGLILPQTILDMPPLGCFNVHASLLPRWRGAAPIERAIEAGDTETGVTIMQMDAGLDTGPVLLARPTPVAPRETAAALHDRLARLGADAVVEAIALRSEGRITPQPQLSAGVTYARKIARSEATIDWTRDAEELDRQVRAFNPRPVMETTWSGRQLRIWAAAPLPRTTNAPPGSVIESGARLVVAAGQGRLQIERLQLAGRRAMTCRRVPERALARRQQAGRVSTAAPTAARIRAAAAQWVAEVADRGRSLDELLADDADEGSARGLKRSLTYGTLRWHFRLKAILAAARRPSAGPARAHASRTARGRTLSAAVRRSRGARGGGRDRRAPRASSGKRAPPGSSMPCCVASSASAPRSSRRSTRTSPRGRRIRAGSQTRSHATGPRSTQAILDANNAHPPLWLRVNRRRTSVDAQLRVLEAAGFRGHRDDRAPDALRVEPAADVRSLPGFADGHVSVQDAAAQLAIELLSPRAGERILDACAAPGGKTGHILERTDGAAAVTAVDASSARLARVQANLDRLGLVATLVAGDAARPDAWWDGQAYDRILLDVPCSATGVIRRHPDIKLLRRPGDLPPLARRQRAMLEALWPLLRPGGRLLYTSCSVLEAENAAVIRAFLADTPAASDTTPTGSPPGRRVRIPALRATPGSPGTPTWTGSIMLASTREAKRWKSATAASGHATGVRLLPRSAAACCCAFSQRRRPARRRRSWSATRELRLGENVYELDANLVIELADDTRSAA